MVDAADDPSREADDDGADAGTGESTDRDAGEPSTEELRALVEEKYDFENFGPDQMAEMSYEEWEAAFDDESWITGTELLDRVEADLKDRVLRRDVFARIERLERPDRVVAYSDEGYAVVYPDGSVGGEGTVMRDVQPTVALASMEDYDVPEMPEGDLLPRPMEVPEGSGEFGNLMIQLVAGAQVLAGLALLGAGVLLSLGGVRVIVIVAGLGFLVVGLFLFTMVANARLSDKFRAEEYRNRLRAVGLEDGERPDFLPPEATEEGLESLGTGPGDDTAGDVGAGAGDGEEPTP